MVTAYTINPIGFYNLKGEESKVGWGIMELHEGTVMLKTDMGCMQLRYCDIEEVKDGRGIHYPFSITDERKNLEWCYHENSDCIFISPVNANYKHEEAFIERLGECIEGTELELLEILCSKPHWENQDISKFDIDYNKPIN